MKVIAIANYKGGVGKTSTVHNVADGLSRKGKKVLMLDLDPQGNLTECTLPKQRRGEIKDTISDAMTAKNVPLPIVHIKERVDLVPCSLRHSNTETVISLRSDRSEVLKPLVDEVRGQYDFILIDCPPTPSLLTVNALVAADSVVIPVESQYLPMKGINQIMKMIEQVKGKLNPSLYLGGILITRYKRNNLAAMVTGTIIHNYSKVFDTIISESVRIAEAPAYCRSIFEHAPKSISARQFAALADEFISMQ